MTKRNPKPKRPNPSNPLSSPSETDRFWKTATREAIRAASDQPDEAQKWDLEVYYKDADHKTLREQGKFLTLDIRLLAALLKMAKGELAHPQLRGDWGERW